MIKNKIGRITLICGYCKKKFTRKRCFNGKYKNSYCSLNCYYSVQKQYPYVKGLCEGCKFSINFWKVKPFKFPKKKLIIKKQPLYGTKFYRTFCSIKQRCNNSRNPRFGNYGFRGIKCLWNSFEEFKKDMYEDFVKHNLVHGGRNTSIERINNDGNYCKENCRWATAWEQSQNRRKKVLSIAKGTKKIYN